MKRIVSLWFPKLSTDRLARASKKDWSDRAAATVVWHDGCPRLAGLNAHARTAGLRPHMRLADARALLPDLVTAPGEPQAGSSGSARVQSTGEFDGVRAYRRGDPQKTVVWKKAAQAFAAGRDDLVSRDTLSSERVQLWLDHARCGGAGLEGRLQRLTAWVLMADRLGLSYGLRLPGREIAPEQGLAHRNRCLEALALC